MRRPSSRASSLHHDPSKANRDRNDRKPNKNDKYPKSKNLEEIQDNNKIEIACENANIDRGIITEESKSFFVRKS